MKFKTSEIVREELTVQLVIEFENGLRLATESLLWCGRDRKAEITAKFEEVVKELKCKLT